jgi:hypothetical protein
MHNSNKISNLQAPYQDFNTLRMSSTCSSDPFGDFDSSESDDTPQLPSFGYVFQTSEDLVEYAQGWGIEARYALIIARSTRNRAGKKSRVYLRCDRGSLPKVGQETTRLIDCKFQLAGHLRDKGWILSVDQSKGK